MKKLIFILLFSVSVVATGAEHYGIKMKEATQLAGKDLLLNGMALRKVYKFGFPVKVYVGGLYLEKKSQDSDEIIKSAGLKKVIMEFKRSVDRDKLVDGWIKGMKKNCFENCDNLKNKFDEIKSVGVNVRKGNRITIDFYQGYVDISTTGPNAKSGRIDGESFSRNLLAVYIHKPKPPSKKFREGLLGMAKD